MTKQRLTQKLNLALSKASAAIAIGKAGPEFSQNAYQEAEKAIDEAQSVLGEIMRAAEAI